MKWAPIVCCQEEGTEAQSGELTCLGFQSELAGSLPRLAIPLLGAARRPFPACSLRPHGVLPGWYPSLVCSSGLADPFLRVALPSRAGSAAIVVGTALSSPRPADCGGQVRWTEERLALNEQGRGPGGVMASRWSWMAEHLRLIGGCVSFLCQARVGEHDEGLQGWPWGNGRHEDSAWGLGVLVVLFDFSQGPRNAQRFWQLPTPSPTPAPGMAPGKLDTRRKAG